MQTRGKFIVIYGINNLGKTVQAKTLVQRLRRRGIAATYIKYPRYDLAPAGALINNYLREGNVFQLTPREAQILYAFNRLQFEKTLQHLLQRGIWVVAEDYVGTGLAWGIGAGVNEKFLKYLNHRLQPEDAAILLDGERFTQSIEQKHAHEKNAELTNRVRQIHQRLARERGWKIIAANQTITRVSQEIWGHISPLIASHQSVRTVMPAPTPLPWSLPVATVTPTAKLPTRAHATDAGLDIYADKNYQLYPGQRTIVTTGIKLAIPRGYVGLIWDKSGLAATGLVTVGGVIDADFRGELKVLVINLSDDRRLITHGQKIAQLLLQKIATPDVRQVADVPKTPRGASGFGSTGRF